MLTGILRMLVYACRLKFGDKESVKRFLIQCFLGEHDEIVLEQHPTLIGFESGTPYQGDISLDRSSKSLPT